MGATEIGTTGRQAKTTNTETTMATRKNLFMVLLSVSANTWP